MKDHLHTLLIGLLVTIIVLSAGYWFLVPMNSKLMKSKSVHKEAAHNPLYYSRLFLKRMGIPTESKTQLTLPDLKTVVVLDSERYVLSHDKVRELWHWVEQGGI